MGSICIHVWDLGAKEAGERFLEKSIRREEGEAIAARQVLHHLGEGEGVGESEGEGREVRVRARVRVRGER